MPDSITSIDMAAFAICRSLADIKLSRFTRKLKKQLKTASTVYIMGHKFSDLDCLGAAYALSCVSKFLGKQSYIVFDPKKTMATSLYKRILAEDGECIFSEGSALADIIDEKTLLIVVDTHRSNFVENEEDAEKVKEIIADGEKKYANLKAYYKKDYKKWKQLQEEIAALEEKKKHGLCEDK